MRDIKNIKENLESFISCYTDNRCVILNRNNIDVNQLAMLKTAYETPDHKGWSEKHQASYENIFNILETDCKGCRKLQNQSNTELIKELTE